MVEWVVRVIPSFVMCVLYQTSRESQPLFQKKSKLRGAPCAGLGVLVVNFMRYMIPHP